MNLSPASAAPAQARARISAETLLARIAAREAIPLTDQREVHSALPDLLWMVTRLAYPGDDPSTLDQYRVVAQKILANHGIAP